MLNLPEQLVRGEIARLIPVVADTSKENRAASVLLAGLMSVPRFASAMFSAIGHRVGARTKIMCFAEVVLKNGGEGAHLRPDGFVTIESGGGRIWTALIEAKIGRVQLAEEQLVNYCHLARLNGIDAVITLSNQFAALPTHHPIKLSKQQTKGLEFYHWSWMHVLTHALVLLNEDEYENPTQKYLLQEVTRYFSHESVGISTFDRMNSEWRDLLGKVQAGSRLSKNSQEVENTIAAWHQESRDLSLLLSRRLNRHVRLSLNRAQAGDPAIRLREDCDKLVTSHDLVCVLDIPNAASLLTVTANLARRSLACSMLLAAPKEKKRTSARVNWLLRQLEKTETDNIFVRAKWPGRAADTQVPLATLRENPGAIEHENRKLVPLSFEVMMVRDLLGKFSGSKTFIEHVENAVPEFYANVGQHLRAWVPPPPRIAEKPDKEEEIGQSDDRQQSEPKKRLEGRQLKSEESASVLSGKSDPSLPAGSLSPAPRRPRASTDAVFEANLGASDEERRELELGTRKTQ